MINQVNLPPEYWYGLTYCAEELGFKSRQELMVVLVERFMEKYPESMAKGREKMLMEDRLKNLDRKPKDPIIPVFMKKTNKMKSTDKIRLVYRDYEKGEKIVNASTLIEGFFQAEGRYPKKDEFDDVFIKWEIIRENNY